MNRNIFLMLIAALFFTGLVTTFFLWKCEDDWCFLFTWQKARAVESFERCAALGFTVAESFPRQCMAGGKTYVESAVLLSQDIRGSDEKVRVVSPEAGAIVRSPLEIEGSARGTWYFEASFPVRLLDANGKEIAVTQAQAKGDWMTMEFVPFGAILVFPSPETDTGTLVFQKDNQSDLPEHDDAVVIPVRFDIGIH